MQVQQGRVFIDRLAYQADLLAALTDVCKKENIRLGYFSVIGAVTCANLGYYDQQNQEYTDCVQMDKKLEIASCVGNISLKDGDIFVHAHATLADHDGKCYAGHLMPGTKIFAAEYVVHELTGVEMHREYDSETGLSLWLRSKEF
ncbi:MAG: DUF296 domain-containing protein [Candidatus Omnitrophica bacterium]|nr:DUF296 domain-containing protein [Candidatus Omnitrophota bacterium]